jgi:WD40 repeat protein
LSAERIEFGALEATIVVYSSGNVVQVHDRANGARIGRIRSESHIKTLAVHPNATAIALADSPAQKGRVRVWSFGSDAEPFSVELEHEAAAIAVFDNFLAVVDGAPSPMGHTRVVVWEIGSKDSRRVLWELYGRPEHAVFADDGAWVALTVIAFGTGNPSRIEIGNLERHLSNPEFATTTSPLNHDAPVENIRADGSGRLLSFTNNGSVVHVWEPAVSGLLGRYRVRSRAYRAALAEGGQWLVAAHKDAKRLQSPSDVSLVTEDGSTLFSASIGDHVDGLACDASGFIAVSTGQSLSVWDGDTGSAVRQVRAKQFTSLVFSADSKHLLVEAPDDGSFVVPMERTKPIVYLRQTGSIWTRAFVDSGAEQVVTVGNPSIGTTPTGDPHVRLWDVPSAKPIALRRRIPFEPIALTHDGRLMATTAADGRVRVRPIVTTGRVRSLRPEAKVTDLKFSDDGKHLAATMKNLVQIWRLEDGAAIVKLEIRDRQSLGEFDPANGLALLYDDGGNGSVVQFNGGNILVDYIVRPDVDFKRSRYATVIEEAKIEVHELKTRRLLMKVFHEYANGVTLAPDGAHVVTTGADGSARIWQISDGAELARLEHPDRVLAARFSLDSRFIATVCSDDIVRVWTWRAEDLIAEGRLRIPRRLTDTELNSFLPDPETRR